MVDWTELGIQSTIVCPVLATLDFVEYLPRAAHAWFRGHVIKALVHNHSSHGGQHIGWLGTELELNWMDEHT